MRSSKPVAALAIALLAVAIALLPMVFLLKENPRQKADLNLLDFFKGLYEKTPKDCPERMAVNQAADPWVFVQCQKLKGTYPATQEELEKIRKGLEKRRDDIIQGQNWPLKQRESVNVPYAFLKPAFDGEMDTPAWNQGLAFHSEYKLGSLEEAKGIEWRILWDESYLYIGVKVPDNSITSYECGKTPGKAPWDGDCIEMFILPSMRMKTYWELVINPENKVFDGLHTNMNRGWFISRPEEDIQGLLHVTKIIPGGYAVQAGIPFSELPNYMLGNKPEPGQSILFSLVRIDDGQRSSPRPLLYDGHNIFGFLQATLVKQQAQPAK